VTAPSLIGSATLIPVRDLDHSIAFYTNVLGFETAIESRAHGFAMVRRGGAMLGLQGGSDDDALRATREMIAAQIWVNDLDAYWDEIRSRLEGLPPGRIRAPFRQPYGVREFHVKDPDGFLMLFGDAGDVGLAA
jgi:predicted enzyme related to lactoylglutathione lyase